MLFIILFFTIFILTKINIRIINILDNTDVYLKIGLIKIHIDYDMFIRNLNKIKISPKFNYKEFKKGLGYYNIIQNIVNNSNVNIKKINVVKKNNSFDFFNIYLNTTYYTMYTFLKNFLTSNTKKQGNISFYVIPSNDDDVDVDIDIEFSLFGFIKSCLLNIKNIIKLKKDMI